MCSLDYFFYISTVLQCCFLVKTAPTVEFCLFVFLPSLALFDRTVAWQETRRRGGSIRKGKENWQTEPELKSQRRDKHCKLFIWAGRTIDWAKTWPFFHSCLSKQEKTGEETAPYLYFLMFAVDLVKRKMLSFFSREQAYMFQ